MKMQESFRLRFTNQKRDIAVVGTPPMMIVGPQ
jgi:hypothetical protein